MPRMIGPDGSMYDIPDNEVADAMTDNMKLITPWQQERPSTNVGRAVNLGAGERARASIRDWAAGIGITDPGNRSDPQLSLTVPTEPTLGGRSKSVLRGLNPLNIADPELLSDPAVGGPKTLLNVLAAVAAGKAIPKAGKITPGATALIESGATRNLADALRVPAGAGLTERQLAQALESTRSYSTASAKGAAAASKVAMPSNAAELVNTLRDAAKASKSPSHSKVLGTLADLGERRVKEVIGSPEGAMQQLPRGFGFKQGLIPRALERIFPGEETIMNRMITKAMEKTGPRVPRGWHRYSRPAVGSLVGSVVGEMEAGDYVRGKGARIGTAR